LSGFELVFGPLGDETARGPGAAMAVAGDHVAVDYCNVNRGNVGPLFHGEIEPLDMRVKLGAFLA